jgi:hypothetical protein
VYSVYRGILNIVRGGKSLAARLEEHPPRTTFVGDSDAVLLVYQQGGGGALLADVVAHLFKGGCAVVACPVLLVVVVLVLVVVVLGLIPRFGLVVEVGAPHCVSYPRLERLPVI